MRVGDIIQDTDTKAIGVIIEKPIPQRYEAPFVYFLNIFGQVVRGQEGSIEVISESR